ncbi:MAG: PAS domain S-box protein [Ginsengibacter sp.]|jgi:PAS domain S-box-containing protein
MSEAEIYNTPGFQKALLLAISKSTFDFLAVVRVSDLKIIFVNEMGAKIFEYENADEMLHSFAPALRKKIPDEAEKESISKELQLNGIFSAEIEYITRNGNIFWGRSQHSSFITNKEEYRLLQIEKIDRAKSAEESLLKEKQRFGALMDYASIGVIIINKQLQIVLMNSCTLRLTGYTKEELSGKKMEIIMPHRFHGKYNLHLSNYFKTPGGKSMESGMDLYAVKKDGTEFPVEISLGNFKTDKENFAILFISDITVRKMGEDEIKKLNADLEIKVKERTDELDITISQLEQQITETEKAREKLVQTMQFQKAVLDSSGAMIIATDSDGTINLFNQAAENLLGYKADEVIGIHNPSIYHDDDETRKRALNFSKELNKEIKAGFEVYVAKSKNNRENKQEWIYVRKDGTKFPVSLSITAFRNKQKKITGFLGVAVDISETKKTEEELKKTLERERELNEMKTRFVSTASHEFRTPLSTVLSSTYLLQKYSNTEDQPKREKHVERIVSSVNQLTDILNDLLSVGKIEEGKVSPKYTHFNIKDHIQRNIDEITGQKEGQKIIFNHSGKEVVWLDPSMLSHVMLNLISNAIKFSPENSAIMIETQTTDSLLKIYVKDQGVGIPKEDQPHLFELFFRGKNVANIQGTGLGLNIVRKYTELMNGKIEFISKPQKGTQFFIEIKITR